MDNHTLVLKLHFRQPGHQHAPCHKYAQQGVTQNKVHINMSRDIFSGSVSPQSH